MDKISNRSGNRFIFEIGIRHLDVSSLYINVFLCGVTVEIKLSERVIVTTHIDHVSRDRAGPKLKTAEGNIVARQRDLVRAV